LFDINVLIYFINLLVIHLKYTNILNLDFSTLEQNIILEKIDSYEKMGDVCAIQIGIFLTLLSLIFIIKTIFFLNSLC
jgi:hypothetical protein